MANPRADRPVPLDRTRDEVIHKLARHFAADNLTAEQLEARLDSAHAATSLEALNAVVSDLPALAEASVPLVSVRAAGPDGSFTRVPAEYVADRQLVVGILGGAERTGVWTPPRSLNAVAVMGGVEIDLRHARFGPGVTAIDVFVLMGGVEVVVPPGVRVECNGIAIMGGFSQSGTADEHVGGEAPVLRIGGFVLMGGVAVEVRHPGESAGDARRREREARRTQRLAAKNRSRHPSGGSGSAP